MDTPDPSVPVPDDPASALPQPPATPPGPPHDTGHQPSAPVALGPVAGGWTPPPPPPPTPPASGTATGGAAWGPISTPYGLAWGPVPIPPAPATARRHPLLVPLIAAVVVISLLAGVGLGYAVRRPGSTSVNAAGNGGAPSSGGSGLFFPSGGSGSTTTPSGSGSSGPADASSIASKVDPGLVDIDVQLGYQQESAAGTGQVLTSSGEVLTNNHVIDEATSISATDIGNGRTYTASVVGYDRTGDLAVIQLHGASGLSTVSIGDSSKVTVGEPIVAIGNAGGTGGTPSVAPGSVTTLNQAITASDDDGSNAETLTGLIEVNANVQPGDSGGPLVDSAGDVVGIDTAASQASFSSTADEGFAIPINQAISIAKQIEAGKNSSTVHVGPTALLGVQVQPSGSDTFGGSSVAGAEVAAVAPGSPAESAGLVMGDVITSAGGQTVSGPTALSSVIGAHRPGDSIQVVWVDADGNQHSATVTLASGPAT